MSENDSDNVRFLTTLCKMSYFDDYPVAFTKNDSASIADILDMITGRQYGFTNDDVKKAFRNIGFRPAKEDRKLEAKHYYIHPTEQLRHDIMVYKQEHQL